VAYLASQYWSAPINEIDWDAQAVRLLIEAVCKVAGVPLPFRGSHELHSAHKKPHRYTIGITGTRNDRAASFHGRSGTARTAAASRGSICIPASLPDARPLPGTPAPSTGPRIVVTHRYIVVTAIEYGDVVITVTSRFTGSDSSSEVCRMPYVTSIAGGPLAGWTWSSRTWRKALHNHAKAVDEVADELAYEQRENDCTCFRSKRRSAIK
jgi:hypothetical protein